MWLSRVLLRVHSLGWRRVRAHSRECEILTELDSEDVEHPCVALTHESEWSLGAYPSGALTWENVTTDDEPRHMNGISRERILELWAKLAEGRIAEIESEPWLPGYEDQC